jgi:pimeloyl-ACP methyl ester carboxylesterase
MADPIPVVVLHGALRSRIGCLPTAWWLRRHGFRARVFGYPTRRGTLSEHGRALGEQVRAWLPEPPPVLGLVTHSMGGLVARAWLGHAGADALGSVQRIVMLSPPNAGSTLARKYRNRCWFRWLYGDAARELGGDVVRSLPPLPASTRALVLAGGNGGRGYNPAIEGDDDGVVGVCEMGLPGIEPECLGGLHSFMQWNPRCLRRAAAFLRSGA